MSRIRGEELKLALLDIARNMAVAQLQEFELKTDSGNCPDNLESHFSSCNHLVSKLEVFYRN